MSIGSIATPGLEFHQTAPVAEPSPGRTNPVAIASDRHATLSHLDFPGAATFTPGRSWYVPLKRGIDLLLASVLLVLTAPFIVAGALIVKLTSRGPAFYRQVRLGKDGRPFTLFKLRTMRQDAEAGTGPVWSTENDPRITPIGHLFRRTHIDEFPQLWNVVKGEMSLVGPRPERPEFVARLDWEIPWYRERLNVQPGITGLAQLRLPADASIDSVRQKVVYDLYYVRFMTPFMDVKLLFLTAWRLFCESVKFLRRAAVLPSHEEIERGYQFTAGMSLVPVDDEPVTLSSLSETRV
ncbi:MAG: sugar transferase [Planctomycetia bacterium]|nr:sugar transferase [Planctomycetia bacterium]